jgi:uncharacterized protein YlxP (DUF503 family)
MPSGFVGVLTCELHFPSAHSLKEKRHFVRSAKAQLQNRVGASVAEVDHHDVWQRTRLTVACVAREGREVDVRRGGRRGRVVLASERQQLLDHARRTRQALLDGLDRRRAFRRIAGAPRARDVPAPRG